MTSSTNQPAAELLPCPFCGAQPEVTEEDGYEDIECANVGCLVQPKALGLSERPSRETWNTRTPTTEAIEAAAKEIVNGIHRAFDDEHSDSDMETWKHDIAAIITKHLTARTGETQ